VQRLFSPFEPCCIRIAVEAHIPDLLLSHPNGLHINELSDKTGIERGKLARILRLLATRQCFREGQLYNRSDLFKHEFISLEVSPDVFANTRVSLPLLKSNPVSDLVAFMTDDCFKGAAFLYETLTDPQYAFSYEGTKAPFMYAEKTRNENITGTIYDYFSGIVSPACYLLHP
jgi:hypothetical protein